MSKTAVSSLIKFWLRWRILFLKAILARRHTLVASLFEILIPIIFSVQIRLIFEPLALKLQDFNQFTRGELLSKIPSNAQLRYAPENNFLDQLMSEVSKVLNVPISPAANEEELVISHYQKNGTETALWAIFQNTDNSDTKHTSLQYMIRSSDIGKSRMIMYDENDADDIDPYISSGFIAFQTAIESCFLNLWKSPNLPITGEQFTLGRFPYFQINFLVMPSVVRPNLSVVYYMTIISFVFSPIFTVNMVIHDKETGFRELMHLMNLSFTMLYLSWINYLMIIAVPVAIVTTMILYPIYSNSSIAVIFLFVLTYITMTSCFMFAIGTFFGHSMKALLTSFIIWLFLAHFTIVVDQNLVHSSLLLRILSLFLPHSGLLYGLVQLTSKSDIEDFLSEKMKHSINERSVERSYVDRLKISLNHLLSGKFELHDMYEVLHSNDRIDIGVIIFSWFIHIALWYSVAIYLDTINPGKFGSAKLPYYLCKSSGPEDGEIDVNYRGSTNWSAVEYIPSFVKPSIRVRRVTKKFGNMRHRITAINEMTIDFYPKEFNVVLGHNGAGKSSLLKIIIGMYKPTSGNIYVGSNDFGKRKSENIIGYCPQENILVHYLTTMQHIYLFGMMKGLSFQSAKKKSVFLMEHLNLDMVKDKTIKSLSFGVQRRLCLAMALIGNTEILVLDEPTYGIDSEHRLQIWDLISATKRDKTIIMSTNSMEAADMLADRIVIIASGKVECYGSKMYLNRRFGIGYVLSIVIKEGCDLSKLQNVLQIFSPGPISLRGTMGLVAKFDMPRSARFTKLFQHLDQEKETLMISSVALNAASIEGPFLRIGMASQFKERRVHFPIDKCEWVLQKRRRDILRSGNPWTRVSGKALWWQQVRGMFYKKNLHIISAWKQYIFSIVCSILAFALTMLVMKMSTLEIFRTPDVEMNVTVYTRKDFQMLYYAANYKGPKEFLVALYKTGQSYDLIKNYHISANITASDFMIHPNLHSIEFRDRFFLSIDIFDNGHINIMHSSTAIHSAPIVINLLHNALLRYHSGSADNSIKLISRPIVDPKQWQHRLVHHQTIRNLENSAIAVTLFLVLPSIDLGMKEVRSLSKLLQMNTHGVSTVIYWMPIYLMDFLLYLFSFLVIALICFIVYHARVAISPRDFLQMLVIFFFYGTAAIPMGYCLQLCIRRTGTLYLAVIAINLVIVMILNGSITMPLLAYLFGNFGNYAGEIIFHALPPYALACAVSNYITLSLHNRQCEGYNSCSTEFGVEDPCCHKCGNTTCYAPSDVMVVRQSGMVYYHSIIDDVLIMMSQTCGFLIILDIFEKKNRSKWFIADSHTIPVPEDNLRVENVDDVVREREKVDEILKEYDETNRLPPDISLLAHDLSKKYDGGIMLKGITFQIKQNECFGLLGLNGSGKSTIFKMLTDEVKPLSGRIIMPGCEMKKDRDQFFGMAGYCPQNGGLHDFLTGRQALRFYATLRGVPENDITDEVNKWLDVLELLDFENHRIEQCSWGVQRKICVLQSLIGDLPIVLLDEPSSGIDVMARYALCDTMHQIRDMGRSILLTTHSMQEAEALCLRVGILVEGKFIATGSCEHLKLKHGNSFLMCIRLQPGVKDHVLEIVKRDVEETFPNITFKEKQLGMLKYEIPNTMPYGNVFHKLEEMKKTHLVITDFSVIQQSMDQVFLEIVKQYREDCVTNPITY